MKKEGSPDLTGTSGSGRRTQCPQVHARAEQIQPPFQTCDPGFGAADPRIFGYFPSLESTSPGGEISPVLLRKSGPRDGQKTNFGRRALQRAAPMTPGPCMVWATDPMGPPAKPKALLGKGGTRECSKGCPHLGVSCETHFVTTRRGNPFFRTLRIRIPTAVTSLFRL